MDLSLPAWFYPEALIGLLSDQYVFDETVLPWDAPALGGHGRPTPGWDADTLDRTAW